MLRGMGFMRNYCHLLIFYGEGVSKSFFVTPHVIPSEARDLPAAAQFLK